MQRAPRVCPKPPLTRSGTAPHTAGHPAAERPKVLDWIAEDQYYCYLVPATLPGALYIVVWNWASMKFFRHN